MYTRMHVCKHVCMHACMYVRMYVCVCVRVCVCMYACMHACMYVCMCVCMYVCMHVCMCACMHACMHVCMKQMDFGNEWRIQQERIQRRSKSKDKTNLRTKQIKSTRRTRAINVHTETQIQSEDNANKENKQDIHRTSERKEDAQRACACRTQTSEKQEQ